METNVAAASAAADYYGQAVSTYGAHIAVGAYGDDGKNTNAGKVHMLTSGSSGWAVASTLEPEYGDGANDEYSAHFGASVNLSGDLLAVGAPGKDKANVYRLVGSTWTLEDIVTHPSSSTGVKFGSQVAINGSVLVVGCPRDSTIASWAGAAFIYTSSSIGGWEFAQGLTHTAAEETQAIEAKFGSSVAVDETNIIIGSPNFDGAANVTGHPGMDGVAYLYVSGALDWTRSRAYTPEDQDSGYTPAMGTGVSISGGTLMIGSRHEDPGGLVYMYEPTSTTTVVSTEPISARGGIATFNLRKQSTSQHLKTTLK